MIQITDCLWNVFAKFICTLSRIHWEPLRRHVYETGARHAELYKEGRPAPLRNVDGRHIEGIGRRCMPVSLQGMPTPLIMSTHFTRGQLTLNTEKMLTLLIMPCPSTPPIHAPTMLIMLTHLRSGQPTNTNRKKDKSLIYIGLVKANKIDICQVFRFISRADCSAAVGEETKQEDFPPCPSCPT